MTAEAWSETFEIPPEGAMLVRPDGHVAWRTLGPAGTETLERALGRLALAFGRPGEAAALSHAAA